MQNIVLVSLELLYPFVTERMHLENYKLVQELIELKYGYRLGTKTFSVVGRKHNEADVENIELPEVPFIKTIAIDGKETEPEEIIIKKNTATVLSEMLNCTRQNINTIMKRGNAYKIRELDYVALQYLKKTYGGEEWNFRSLAHCY